MVKMSEKKELNKRKKIALIGTFPPPIGGTSIHVMRLREKLVDNEYDVMVYDTHGTGKAAFDGFVSIQNYKKWIIKYFFTMKEDIIHSHTHEWKERAILSIGAKLHRKKMIFTFHSLREELEELSYIDRKSLEITFKHADTLICTSKEVRDKLLRWGCTEDKLAVITPFICPTKAEVGEKISENLNEFRQKHDYIISANASNNDHYQGEDLYGLDMCVELIRYLNNKQINVGLIFAQTKITDEAYYNEIKKKIDDYGIEEKVFFVTKTVSFIPILKISDIFVRPTNTDTCGISVNESLQLGIPTIASDVCKRADGTILFHSRNMEEFVNKTEMCISKLDYERKRIEELSIKEGFQEIVKVYI